MKAKEKKEATSEVNIPEEAYLYDTDSLQIIPFTVTQGNKTVRASHTLNVPSNERYLQMQSEIEDVISRAKKASSLIFDPKIKLWRDIVVSRQGWVERDDWKDRTHPADAIGVINALFWVSVLDEEDQIVSDNDEILLDDDDGYIVKFNTRFGAAELQGLSHTFRQESKAEMDEYLAIIANEPNSNELASAAKRSRVEKLYRLGTKLLVGRTGYTDESETPAWHLAFTTEAFFTRQLARMGKSLAA